MRKRTRRAKARPLPGDLIRERDRALVALEALGRQVDLIARVVANIVRDIKRHYNPGVSYGDYWDPQARLTGRQALDFGKERRADRKARQAFAGFMVK